MRSIDFKRLDSHDWVALASFTIGIAAIIWGWINGTALGVVCTVVVLVIWGKVAAWQIQSETLKHASVGAIDVTTVKANQVRSTIQRYNRQGWAVQQQSASGRAGNTQVTLTFQRVQS